MHNENFVLPRLVARGISKRFGAVQALRQVDFSLARGEIHALLGENGAGKSTLGKICSGVYLPDAGEILLEGHSVSLADEVAAGKLGIGIVHQEGSLVPGLTVAENIFAGRQPSGFLGQIDRRKMRREAATLLMQLESRISPDTKVGQLSAAQRQVVEIAKALSQNLRVLILDEPTAALSVAETESLFRVIRSLAAAGISIVYVSHRLAEIFALCHRVTVLKDGALVGSANIEDTNVDKLVQMMVGRELHFSRHEPQHKVGPPVLVAERLADGRHVKGASLQVRSGEIVCLAGLVGSGRTEFCELVFGATRSSSGTMTLLGKAHRPAGPHSAMAAGVGMVCEDRKEAGLFLDMDIAANIAVTVPALVTRGGQVSERAVRDLAADYVARLNIATPSTHQLTGNLSGGNQQKVLLAKWLALNPRLLIVDEPTRGVDVGARTEIYRILRELAASGVALLVVSSDLPEVLTLADRIVVMSEGQTVGELSGQTATEEAILQMATAQSHLAEAS